MRRIDSPFSAVVMLGIAMLSGCASHDNLSTANSQVSFGVKAARMDLWREARFRFERAVQLDPNDAMAHNNLAVAYEGSGDFDRARLEYVRALQIDKSNQYIQKNYSRFMEFYGRSKKREAVPAAAGKPAAAPAAPATPATPPSQPPGPAIPPPPTGATSAESPQPGAPTPPPPGGAA